MDDGQPYVVSGFYTNSLNEKSRLRPMLESWRGRPFTEEELDGFDLQNVLGKPCLLSVIHKDGKARVSGASALTKGMDKPAAKNELKSFWIEEWDQETFDGLPEGFKKLIMQSDEYKKRTKGDGPVEDLDDDLPF